MSAIAELIGRLGARAENAKHTADKMREMDYHGEALLWEARAATYTEAKEIALRLMESARPGAKAGPEDYAAATRGAVTEMVRNLVQRKEVSNG